MTSFFLHMWYIFYCFLTKDRAQPLSHSYLKKVEWKLEKQQLTLFLSSFVNTSKPLSVIWMVCSNWAALKINKHSVLSTYYKMLFTSVSWKKMNSNGISKTVFSSPKAFEVEKRIKEKLSLLKKRNLAVS